MDALRLVPRVGKRLGTGAVRSHNLEQALRAGALLRPPRDATPHCPLDMPPRAQPPAALAQLPPPTPHPAPALVSEPEPPQSIPIPPPEASRPAYRRVGRLLLGLLRPLALPLLNRLDWRIRGAVDRTETGEAVRRTEAILEALSRRFDQVTQDAAQRQREVESAFAAMEAARTEDRQMLLAAAEAARARDIVLEQLTLRLDAARLQLRDGIMATGAVRADIAAANALIVGLHQKSDGQAALLGGLHAKADQLAHDAAVALPTRLDSLSGRLDLLVRRHAIPAGDDVAIRTDDGYLIVPGEDESNITALVEAAGRLESGMIAVACALAWEGSLAVDVGAHVGAVTVPLARRVGPAGLVVAVEPTPRTVGVLRRTLALNGLTERVILHECAAGAADGTARLELAAIGSHNSLLPLGTEAVGAVEVAVRPLDALVPAGREISVLKIDAEGMELEVLRGAERLLHDNGRAGVIVEFGPSHLARAGIAIDAWLDAFAQRGLAPWIIDEGSGALHPLPRQDLAALHSANLLWLRDRPETYPGLHLA